MEYILVIPGKMESLNDYIYAERSTKYHAAGMKKKGMKRVSRSIEKCLRGVKIRNPVYMDFKWVEPTSRRDPDNISSYGRKVILDALVNSGVIEDDSWKYIVGFSDRFQVDKDNPHIEVQIREVES